MISFQTIDWTNILQTEHKGESGTSFWRTIEFPALRIRMIEYSPGYVADHWCNKGHIVHCLDGEFTSELEGSIEQILSAGMTYIVSDDASSHRSHTVHGAKLLVIDGDFLNR
jgi:hypothetical protein